MMGGEALRNAWFVARKDVRYMLRQRETLFWTFLMPPVFFFLIGTITAGFADADGEPPLIALVAPGAGFLADQLSRRLEDQGFDVERPTSVDDLARYERRLVLPAGFTDSLITGRRVKVRFERESPGELKSGYDEVRVGRAVYSVLGDVILLTAEGLPLTASELERRSSEPRPLQLEVRQAGKRRRVPVGFEQSIPGIMVMFTLLVLLTSGGVLLVIERQQGLLRRLASSPMSRGSVVLGKWLGRMALGILQIASAMLIGTLLLRMRWGPDLPAVLLVLVTWAGLAATLGLLVGNLARSEGQASGFGTLASIVLAALGGCWWPIEITPQWMQRLALFLPTGLTMDALHKLVSFGAGASAAVPHVIVLCAGAVLCGWIASRTFRFQ